MKDKPGSRARNGQPRLVSDANGRIPAFVPTQEQRNAVKTLAAHEISQVVMAQVLDVSPGTLVKHFSDDIRHGRAHIEARIGNSVVREALAGNMAAARMWLMSWGHPNWKGAKDANPSHNARDDSPTVKFYIPENGRDKPEDLGPIIDGTATRTDATGTDG